MLWRHKKKNKTDYLIMKTDTNDKFKIVLNDNIQHHIKLCIKQMKNKADSS